MTCWSKLVFPFLRITVCLCVPRKSSKLLKLQGKAPLNSSILRDGFNPILLNPSSELDITQAVYPENLCFKTSPTDLYNPAIDLVINLSP